MEIKTLSMSPAEEAERIMRKQEYQHETGLNFLKTHKGWRNGNIHIYLGTAGSGKSTMLRTIIDDYLEHNPINTIGVWLSEETIGDLKDEMAKLRADIKPLLNHVHVESEMEGMNRGDLLSLKERFRTFVNSGIDILLFDNITTSAMYEGLQVNVQSQMQGWMKDICLKANIPFVLFAHTSGAITDTITRQIDMNDIRGSKGINSIAQFYYVSQRFEIGGEYFPTLKIRKYRGYDLSDRLFFLTFSKENFIYSKDHKLPWDEFNKAFSNRNILK
jgi:archaellum biogenesis ATPase FlaH